MDNPNLYLKRARAELPRTIAHRRALHRIPEIGLELPETAAYVEAELKKMGLHPRRVGSGLWADIGEKGPLVALRADMDALPIAEMTKTEYASERPGRMHACGHDAHTAALLSVAAILNEEAAAGSLPFRARLIFQPGEEGFFGALGLIEAGCLEGVCSIAAGHVGFLSDEQEPGQAGFISGPMMAASDRFRGSFGGSGGHGSAPHHCADPIAVFAEFMAGIQSFRARELDQTRPAVVSVCSVHSGSAYNVIPERLEYSGTARSLHADIRATLERRLGEIARAFGSLRGLETEFEWLPGYPPLVNDASAAKIAENAARSLLGGERIVQLSRPIMGGEDFAYYLEKVPGAFWFFDTRAPARGIVHPNHNPRFDIDEGLLADFVATSLSIAADFAKEFGA